MPEEYLQVSFEIKAACDEISRRLLRWHWEQKPGSHTVESLLQHLEVRRKESPLYYDRLPDLERKTSWQQLDTTLCMRVLLDPEKDAAKPLDLLGNTAHPGAARRACNAVRTARNEAAHAADRTGGVQAALLFDEAIERLEEGYAGAAFSEKELEKYYKLAKEYMERCGAGHSAAGTRANPKPSPEPSQGREGAAGPARKAAEPPARTSAAGRRASGSGPARESGPARGNPPPRRPARTTGAAKRQPTGKRKPGQTRRRKKGVNRVVLFLMLLALAAGLLVRGWSMRGG